MKAFWAPASPPANTRNTSVYCWLMFAVPIFGAQGGEQRPFALLANTGVAMQPPHHHLHLTYASFDLPSPTLEDACLCR